MSWSPWLNVSSTYGPDPAEFWMNQGSAVSVVSASSASVAPFSIATSEFTMPVYAAFMLFRNSAFGSASVTTTVLSSGMSIDAMSSTR